MQAFGRYRSDRDSTQNFMSWFFSKQAGPIQSNELEVRYRRIADHVAFLEQKITAENVTQHVFMVPNNHQGMDK